MDIATLSATAKALVAPGKGILAADESSGTIKKRFDSISVDSTEDNRRDYREMLFTAKDVGDYISGVILFDETLRQDAADGTPLVKLLEDQGIIPGIKVDTGAKPLAGADGETVTEGLDGLRERLAEYRSLGARFAKWRADLHHHRHAAERVLHRRERARARALRRAVPGSGDRADRRARGPHGRRPHDRALLRGHLGGARLAVRGAVPPAGPPRRHVAQAEHGAVRATGRRSRRRCRRWPRPRVRCYRATVPAAVPGIVFLSGGQTDELATAHLNAMNQLGDLPWQLSFSYGRALQAAGAEGVEGRHGERRRRAQRVPPPGEAEQRRPFRDVHARHGESGQLTR